MGDENGVSENLHQARRVIALSSHDHLLNLHRTIIILMFIVITLIDDLVNRQGLHPLDPAFGTARPSLKYFIQYFFPTIFDGLHFCFSLVAGSGTPSTLQYSQINRRTKVMFQIHVGSCL